MKRLSNIHSGTAASTEYHVVKRILAGLLAATCMLSASAAHAANVLPSVSLTTPVANAQYTAPAAVPLTAVASDPDGTIASVTYYRGTTWIGSSSVAPYSVHWSTAAAGTYSITARATDNLGGVTISAPISVVMKVNAAPTVAIVSPLNNASFTAPGTIALKASAADADGSINRVAYYNGTTYLAASTTSPYSFNWTNVAAGSYSITAKVYDNNNAVTTSAPIAVTVTAPVAATQVFYVYSDQVDTAQEITNAVGVKVWQADPEPFGANAPNDNPAGQGTFAYNPRFPGQYFDRETGLHYNYHRDYDPQTGRYIQSDPIGLTGGINTYGYVGGNPTSFVDPTGLITFVGGVGASYVAGGGIEGSGGLFVNPGLFGQKADLGVFSSGGYGGGVNVSGSVFGGVVFGEASNVAGPTTNANGGVGPLSWTMYYSGGKWTGITVGIGPGLPVAGSLTKSNTVTGSIRDLVEWWNKRKSVANYCSE